MEKEILKKIEMYDYILIHRHQNPDGDALGSQFGLASLIKLNFPKKKIMLITPENIEENSLFKLFTKKFDYIENKNFKNTLAIIIDTANKERIAGDQWLECKESIKIDHHPQTDIYSKNEFINDIAASSTEIISKIARINNLKIDYETAAFLMLGMITDTQRFAYSSVSKETMKEAAFLVESGASINKITSSLNNNSVSLSRIKGEILKNFKFDRGIASYLMPKGLHKKFKLNYSDVSSMVYLLNSNNDVKASLYSTYDEENKSWKTSLRSNSIEINEIASKFNGGGHKYASGAKLKNKKEFKKLLEVLIKEVNNEK